VKQPQIHPRRAAEPEARSTSPLVVAGALSLIAYGILQALSSTRPLPYGNEMTEAARTMERAIEVTREYCDSAGIEISNSDDPNHTCLIGPELTGLMTTLGHVDAKRTTTDPAMASLMVHLLDRAGVSAGERIAVGSSASFPALLIATLAAAEAMNLRPVAIISLGSSTYGATNPDFNLLDIYTLLLDKGVLATPPAAISLGGTQDVGNGFEPDLKVALLDQITASHLPFISEPDLRKNVFERMAFYEGPTAEDSIAAFVNAGGSYANLGTSSLALRLQPGLNTDIVLPPEQERGVLFEMAARGVPVIHLLFIRGLALRYGLNWDPIPLSGPGETALHPDRSRDSRTVWLVGIPYFVAVVVLLGVYVRSSGPRPHAEADIAG
jgi:poly-gamma-glutamate system protein